MKRSYILFFGLLAVFFTACSRNADVTGHWVAERYAIAVQKPSGETGWSMQGAEFTSSFTLDFMKAGAMQVSAFGTTNAGTYTVSNDTVFVTVKDASSKYVARDGNLYLIENPKARVEYIRSEE